MRAPFRRGAAAGRAAAIVAALFVLGACDASGEDGAEAGSPWQGYELERAIGEAGDAVGRLRDPMGVDVDAQGRIWVADTGNARVQVFEPDGSSATVAGEGFTRPVDVAVTREGRVWIADLGADRVRCLRVDGGACSVPDVEMPAPSGVGARDRVGPLATQLYGHRVVSASGSPQLSVGGEGGGSGELMHPADVAVLPDGSFAVADAYNHRVQRYDARGRAAGAWTGPPEAPFHVPTGLAVAEDVVHVADSGRRRVVALSLSGEVLASWRLESDENPRILSPTRVAATADRVYAADPANHRILVLRRVAR